jgi:hypothetical protein
MWIGWNQIFQVEQLQIYARKKLLLYGPLNINIVLNISILCLISNFNWAIKNNEFNYNKKSCRIKCKDKIKQNTRYLNLFVVTLAKCVSFYQMAMWMVGLTFVFYTYCNALIIGHYTQALGFTFGPWCVMQYYMRTWTNYSIIFLGSL